MELIIRSTVSLRAKRLRDAHLPLSPESGEGFAGIRPPGAKSEIAGCNLQRMHRGRSIQFIAVKRPRTPGGKLAAAIPCRAAWQGSSFPCPAPPVCLARYTDHLEAAQVFGK
jgi:hypothetical protein